VEDEGILLGSWAKQTETVLKPTTAAAVCRKIVEITTVPSMGQGRRWNPMLPIFIDGF
jgi:hypothetical protein